MSKPDARDQLLTWCAAAGLIVFGAIMAGSGDFSRVAVVIGAGAGMLLLFRLEWLLWFIVLGGLVFAGVAQLYLPQIQFIRWSIGLLAAVLGGVAFLNYLFGRQAADRHVLPPLFWWVVAFAAVALLTSVLNFRDLKALIFGFKGYFQIWGLFFAIVLMNWRWQVIDSLPRILCWVAFLQLPFVIHQYLYLVPARIHLGNGVVAEDVVSGTFGASATGGGANASLSVLLIIVMAMLTSLYKIGRLSTFRLLIGVVLLVVPILLNANKVAIFYLMLASMMMFSGEMLKRPAKATIMAIFGAVFVLAVLWSYSTVLSRSDSGGDWRDFVVTTLEQNFSRNYGYGEYELNRWTTITYWVEEHRTRPWGEILLGHGLGEAREGEGGVVNTQTLAQREYSRVGIGLTAVSAILWELGLLGLTILFCMLASAFRAAGKVANSLTSDPWRSAILRGLQVGVIIFAISLFHKKSLIFYLPYQTLFALVLGYIGFWHSQLKTDSLSLRHAQSRRAPPET